MIVLEDEEDEEEGLPPSRRGVVGGWPTTLGFSR